MFYYQVLNDDNGYFFQSTRYKVLTQRIYIYKFVLIQWIDSLLVEYLDFLDFCSWVYIYFKIKQKQTHIYNNMDFLFNGRKIKILYQIHGFHCLTSSYNSSHGWYCLSSLVGLHRELGDWPTTIMSLLLASLKVVSLPKILHFSHKVYFNWLSFSYKETLIDYFTW